MGATSGSIDLKSATAVLPKLRFYDADESHYAGLKPPAIVSSSVDYELPAAPPAVNGYQLSCTTAGVMSWVAAGTGTVTSVSCGNLSPLFTSSVANSTTTPSITFTLSTQLANRFFGGPASGAATAPTFRLLDAVDMPNGLSAIPARGGIFYSAAGDSWDALALGAAGAVLRSDGTDIAWTTTPTWTGAHTFSNATNSAFFTGGPTGFGISASLTAGIDVEKVPASSQTFAKFGSSLPIYMVGVVGGGGSPALAFNLRYTTAWVFGKGSASNYGGTWSYAPSTGLLEWYNTNATGNADAAATLVSRFSISAAGVVNIAGLTASKLVRTDASKNLSSYDLVATDVPQYTQTASTINGSSTDYTLTTSYATVDFGAGDPTFSVPTTGVYLLVVGVLLQNTGGSTQYSFKLRNTTDSADIAGTERIVGTYTGAGENQQVVITTTASLTAGKTIALQGMVDITTYTPIVKAAGTVFSYIRLS